MGIYIVAQAHHVPVGNQFGSGNAVVGAEPGNQGKGDAVFADAMRQLNLATGSGI
jgi:hypothetical protein